MPYVTVGEENSGAIDLYYEDHGAGKPVVLIHGWPLSGRSWEKQVPVLVEAGHRVITYDRRGFGGSSKPWGGYDYDTLARDLDRLMTKLDLRDTTLVGFSMGGGEVARYPAAYGTARLSKVAFIAAITPALLKGADNPEGVDLSVFDGLRAGIKADRPAFLTQFLSNFYNLDVTLGKLISEEAVRLSWSIASQASPKGTYDLVGAWGTDFREDLKMLELPTLVVHGDADRILPVAVSGRRTHALIKNSQYVEIPGGPHGLNWTHADALNRALLEFLKAPAGAAVAR
jgi:pimeloyl-ACP methyl ester carboxylesterase